MQKFYFFNIAILCFIAINLQGQNNCTALACSNDPCPSMQSLACDQTINSGNLQNLQMNRTYCITGNVTIQGNIPSGVTIYISSAGVVNTSNINQFAGHIINCGTFNQGNSTMGNGTARIDNYGTFNTSTNTFSSSDDIFVNHPDAQMNINGEWNIEDTEVLNCGMMDQTDSNRSINLRNGTCFLNNADIMLEGNFTVGSGAKVDNYGVILSEKDININANGNVFNACTLYSYTRITCDGILVNNALILCDDPNNNSPSNGHELVQISNGMFTNNGLVIGNEFSNSGTVNGENGEFHFLGFTTNNGTFGGTSPSTLNFYDTTNSNSSEFDNGASTNNTTDNSFVRPENNNELINNCAASFLPIELIYFKVNANANLDYVDIKWATAVEINNEFFEIHHSLDGNNWTTITQVAGQINSSRTETYKYRHQNTPFSSEGIHYYRLKQIDLDGQFSFSKIQSVRLEFSTARTMLYPNPIKIGNQLYIRADEIKSIHVYDQLGQIVLQKDYSAEQEVYISINNLPLGYYTLSVNHGTGQKLLIIE